MSNNNKKNVLTTGQVAKICNVAPRTVSKWFDSGQLRGYRIPGSKDRRIPAEQLLRFMKNHGIPTTGLELGTTGVLIIDDDRELSVLMCEALNSRGRYDAFAADSAFEAGVLVANNRPHVIIVDAGTPDVSITRICQTLRSHDSLSNIKLIATGASMTEGQGLGLVEEGVAGFLCKPFDLTQLEELIQSIIE